MANRRTARRAAARRRRGLRKEIPLGREPVPDYMEYEMKLKCNKCERELEAEEHFTPRKDVPRGYQYSCRDCRAKEEMEYRQRSREAGIDRGNMRKSGLAKNAPKAESAPKPGRGRPKGAKDKKPRKERCDKGKTKKETVEEPKKPKEKKKKRSWSHKARHRHELIMEGGKKISNGEVLADTSRTFTFNLRLIIEQQLRLFYESDMSSVTGKVRVNNAIDDGMFEIKEAIERVSKRAYKARESEKEMTDLTDTLGRIKRRAEAFAILGLKSNATDEQIRKEFKKRAAEDHPDHGGSEEKMQRLNEALEILLEKKNGG